MASADSAVLQLQDSDASYAQFRGVQSFVKYYWLLYIVTWAIFFLPGLIKLYPKKEGK
jgi:hypothetical protein